MRSQLLLRRTRLSRTSSVSTRALLSYSGPARYPRNDTRPTPARVSRVARRASTSSPKSPEANSSPSTEKPNPPSSEHTASNGKNAPDATTPALQLSNEQDFFWSYQSLSESEPSTLPPPEVFEEVLNNVHISLHPRTQDKAAFSTPNGPPIEPTVALYCPIEGGNYIIDDTVRELARRTGSDVVVLDSVHMAAGEWGHFGQAASLIELPQNPLHFSPQATMASPVEHDDDDVDGPGSFSHMTVQFVIPRQASRMPGNVPSKGGMVKAKTFFDMCINVQAPNDTGSSSITSRSRLIYIRDFPTLSSSWASLHPALLSAVRQRRQSPLSRSTSPVVNPTVIIFGITPTIFPPSSTSLPPGPQGMMNMLTSRSGQATPSVAASRPGKSDWGEEDHAEKARELRLRERLRKWDRGDHALQSELPKFLTGPPVEDESGTPGQPNVMPVGGPGGGSPLSSFLAPFGPLLGGGGGLRPNMQAASPNTSTSSGFMRTSILVPASRSLSHEKASRMGGRREINELTMRMAVGSTGGLLETRSAASMFSVSSEPPSEHAGSIDLVNAARMWDDWGNKIEVWTTVKQIGDQAVGHAISSSLPQSGRSSLSSVPITWVDICAAWADQRASHDLRKAWIQQSSNRPAGGDQQNKNLGNERDRPVDDIVETVKHDPYLDPHEQRLLGCIVDSVSMPTSFARVHLPAHTIDSVRTIVSLPLLHPTAFQQGVLKEHSMTGCLLFGPPGTGKTLVVRALAKEAGCRMLAISPSDVMDMYVGEGEKLVRSVFSLARRLAPCVVFIDEIDALFGARSSSRDTGGGFVHRGVITEFMQEMDGLKTSNTDNVIVIGATNRPFDLDDAVLRRLPRRLLVDLPGESEREEILKIHLRDEVLSPEVELKVLARDTPTFSGSDLKHLCVSAALDAVKENVSVPWVVERSKNLASEGTSRTSNVDGDGDNAATQPSKDSAASTSTSTSTPQRRILGVHNFAKALREITPSASESLGTLADLRRWNDEFGEGRKRKKQVWGKDRFGFTRKWDREEDGKVATPALGTDKSL